MRRMRRKSAVRRGRFVPILVAAGVGYLIGSWSTLAVHSSPGSSAAQAVALRFPQDLSIAQPQQAARTSENSMVIGATALTLFQPEPLIPHPAMVTASLSGNEAVERAAPPPAPVAVAPAPAKPALAGVAKPHPAPAHVASRPGYLLDDAQIAGIKRRLHLTPDQEEMWPAVEGALRQIAFAKAHDPHRRGIDPNSTEVQDLKSAAIPLLMSFSSEQKDEVRNLAHVMGLDQLASQF
jgi:hypothetical protein